jgi:DNA mismatch repair protein MutL
MTRPTSISRSSVRHLQLDGDDLLQINTLGFRGDALPSIGRWRGSPSPRVTPANRMPGRSRSYRCEVGDQTCGAPAPVSRSRIWYATPARLKFLKATAASRSGARGCAAAGHEPAGRRLHARNEERAPVTWPAALPGGRPSRPACRRVGRDFRANAVEVSAEREGTVVEAMPGCRRTAAPTRSGNICSSTAARCGQAADRRHPGTSADYPPRDRRQS